eukprot:14094-Heterococcus_DN1.PRE.2
MAFLLIMKSNRRYKFSAHTKAAVTQQASTAASIMNTVAAVQCTLHKYDTGVYCVVYIVVAGYDTVVLYFISTPASVESFDSIHSPSRPHATNRTAAAANCSANGHRHASTYARTSEQQESNQRKALHKDSKPAVYATAQNIPVAAVLCYQTSTIASTSSTPQYSPTVPVKALSTT